jgi:photosystem II stability/assembly factor-like uncharacterized protein
MIANRGWAALVAGVFSGVALALAAGLARAAAPPAAEAGAWQGATGNLAEKEWAGDKGVWKLTAWPGKDLLVVSMVEKGLWASKDGGKTWARLGAPGKTPPDKGSAIQFIFDPKNKDAMWCSGMYGFGLWATADGGATFAQLGKETHMDGMAVDFSEPLRRILLHGKHETANSLERSVDGGKTWQKIGDKIPAGFGFTTDPIILDSKTFIVNSAGWGDKKWGIWRSEDAGETWAKVSDAGPGGNATVTTKGHIFWPCYWDFASIHSTDKGKTWSKLGGPVSGAIVEIMDGKLAGLGGGQHNQVYISADEGKNWAAYGKPAPFKAEGLVYNDVGRSFYVWRQGERKGDPIQRLDLGKDAGK